MNPHFVIRPSDAKKLRKACAEKLQNLLNGAKRVMDATMIPNMAQYILARRNVEVKTPISRCPEETNTTTELLLELIVDENMTFAVCDNREFFIRALRKMFAYLRPGYRMPLGGTIRRKLLDEYYERMIRELLQVI